MKPLKIIAIEDDIDFGELLKLTLTTWGHNVTLQRNWLAMMRTLGSESFDLIIADVETPTGNSLTALEFLSRNEEVRRVPKIFLTGLNDAATKASCLALDAGHVHKSTRVFDDLKQAVLERVEGSLFSGTATADASHACQSMQELPS